MSNSRGVSVWQDPCVASDEKLALALTDKDKDILRRLQQGEHHGLNLERIHGARKNILVVRTNKKRRLFLWVKGSQMVVIHIMTNHKYHRLSPRISEFIFGEVSDEAKEPTLVYSNIETIEGFKPDPHFQVDKLESATCYNQDLIVYDENQRAVLAEKLPVFLHGDFGSGKSAIARSLLIKHIIEFHETNPESDYVYYSHLPGLVVHMRQMFLLDNPELSGMLDLDRVKFLDTLGLVREYGPQELSDYAVVGVTEFQAYVSKHYQGEVQKLKGKQQAFLKGISINTDIDMLYDEVQLIATLSNDEKYLGLGASASNYSNLDVRKWLIKVTNDYLNHLNHSRAFDPALFTWHPVSKRIALLVADEMQGAPRSVVQMIPRLTLNQNVLLCCDSNQSERRLSLIPYIKEVFTEHGMPLNVCVTPGSYRSPAHMMPLINTVIGLKQYINGGLNDKHQSSMVECKSGTMVEKGSIHWVDLSALASLKAKLLENNTVYVVITHEAYVQDAKQLFGDDVPVYTPAEARGMEFPVVVQYRLMDKPMPPANKGGKPRLLSELINPLIAEMPSNLTPAKHQPKSGKANPIYEPELNAWVIAFSRLVGDAHCFVVEASNKQSKLHRVIKSAIMEGQTLMKDSDQTLAAGTRVEWEALALQNIEAGHREQALVAYRRLGKTTEELDRDIALHEQKKQDRINRALKAAEENKQKRKQAMPTKSPLTSEKLSDHFNEEQKRIANQIFTSMEAIIERIMECKDKVSALNHYISNTDVKLWFSPSGFDKNIFILRLLGNDEVARGFYTLILKNKSNPIYRNFIECVFTNIDWLDPWSESDLYFTRLHWMMGHQVRALIFKFAWDVKICISVDKEMFHTAFAPLAMTHYIPDQKITLTLFSFLLMKHTEFLKSLVTAFPGMGIHLMMGLLEPFKLNGGETNAIQWLSTQSVPLLSEKLTDILMMHNEELYRCIFYQDTKFSHPKFHQVEAIEYCSRIVFSRTANAIIKHSDVARLDIMFRESMRIDDELSFQLSDGKTFAEKIIIDEALRECFLSHLVQWILNARPQGLIIKALDKMLETIPWNFNAPVNVGQLRYSFIVVLHHHPRGDLLLKYFTANDPTSFYLNKVNMLTLMSTCYSNLMGGEIPALYLMAKACSPHFSVFFSYPEASRASYYLFLGGYTTRKFGNESILMAWLGHFKPGQILSNQESLCVIDSALALLLSYNEDCVLMTYFDYYLDPTSDEENTIPPIENPSHLMQVCIYLAVEVGDKIAALFKKQAALFIENMGLSDLISRVSFAKDTPTVFYYLAHLPACFEALIQMIYLMDANEATDNMNDLYEALTEKRSTIPGLSRGGWSALAMLSRVEQGVELLCEMLRRVPGLAGRLKEADFVHPEEGSLYRDGVMRLCLTHSAMANLGFIRLIELHNPALSAYKDKVLAEYIIEGSDSEDMQLCSSSEEAETSDTSLQRHSLFAGSGLVRSSSTPLEPERGADNGLSS